MQKVLTPPERLIVAADLRSRPFSGQKDKDVALRIVKFARELAPTGVCIKLEGPAGGLELVRQIHDLGLPVFSDLKLGHTKSRLLDISELLHEVKPEFVTVMCSVGVSAMRALKAQLRGTTVLGVTVPTTFTDLDVQQVYRRPSVERAVVDFAMLATQGGITDLVLAPTEARMLRNLFGNLVSINTPGVRPEGCEIDGDDQNPERIMTPAKAIKAGADRIVVGRPITQAENPHDAVMRTIEEIARVT